MSTVHTAPPATSPEPSIRQSAEPLGTPWLRRLLVLFLIACSLLTFGYASASIYLATQLVNLQGRPLDSHTPADFGLAYHNVQFPSRDDHLLVHGWFIPGVLPSGQLTSDRTIIVMPGHGGPRNDHTIKLLNLESDLAHSGFAVLTFDPRNAGQSPKAVDGVGYFEQRDALGAADFLQTGTLPYPDLARPRVIGALGTSMGAVSLIYATARDSAIRALVSDSAFADILPIYERDIPKGAAQLVPPLAPVFPAFVPGTLVAADVLYGLNGFDNRPVDVVASIAPRPIFFIHAAHDDSTPSSMMDQLTAAASAPTNAHVQSWKVPGVYQHAESYATHSVEYIARVTTFFASSLGPDRSAAA